MAYIGRQNLGGAYRQLDDISSGFDGSDTTHTMQVNSQNVTVGDVNQIMLSLGGVIQKPGTDFTVSGSTLTFTTAPASGLSFFAILLGSDNGGTVTPTDGSVTGDKVASSGAFTIGATGTASTVAGIPLFSDTSNGSIYTHDVSGTDSTAQNNTAFGLNALDAITTGDGNTAIGKDAGTALTTGGTNVFIGYEAGKSGTGVNGCTFVGEQAGRANTEDSNTAIGRDALYTNTTGRFNVAIGDGALTTSNDSGGSDEADYNVAVGYQANSNLTTGYKSTAIGYQAGNRGTTTNGNVLIGYQTYGSQTSYGGNNLVGNSSGQAMTSGYYNNSLGTASLSAVTEGYNNISIGHDSGQTVTTGNHNIYMGYKTKANDATDVYSILIGHGDGINNFNSGGGNTVRIGKRTAYITNDFSANATWSHSSDERYKKDIQDNTDCGLNFINELRPITYKWKAQSELDTDLPEYDKDKTEADYTNKNYGLIAQEVKTALDKLNITDFGGWKTDPTHEKDRQEISEQMFIFPLIKAVQELSAKVTTLETEVDTLKTKVTALEEA